MLLRLEMITNFDITDKVHLTNECVEILEFFGFTSIEFERWYKNEDNFFYIFKINDEMIHYMVLDEIQRLLFYQVSAFQDIMGCKNVDVFNEEERERADKHVKVPKVTTDINLYRDEDNYCICSDNRYLDGYFSVK